ncbi:MAG: M20/M25/M40 family metallo-hydrolase [Thermoanaerobaculaceae bacterium]
MSTSKLRRVRDHEPDLVVTQKELAGLDSSPSSMRMIPGSRMFEIRDALAVYKNGFPNGEVFDASQGDGGASLPGVPDDLLDAAHELVKSHGSAYDQPYGTDIFRKAVVEDYWRLDAATGWGPANVLACQGGRDALLKAYDAMQFLGSGRRGDFVVVTRVPWISYAWGPYSVGANVMLAPGAEAEGWALTPEGVAACTEHAAGAGGRRVAGLVVTSPDNPTGGVLSQERQLELARAAFAAGVPFVLFDWIYHWVTDGLPHDLNRFLLALSPEERERCIFLDGLTKSLGASNIRNAHLVAGASVVKFMQNRASHGVIPSFHSQAVAVVAYRRGFAKACAGIVPPTSASRALLRSFLAEKKIGHVLGQGYYAFVDVGPWLDKTGMADSGELGTVLAERFGLAVVPGVHFSRYGARWVRFSWPCRPKRRPGPSNGSGTRSHRCERMGVTDMNPAEWHRFAEKARLAVESSLESHFESGTSGLEVEFNVLKGDLQPVLRVGWGPQSRSFADYLHDRFPAWLGERAQLEVFHWMTEVATRPYYSALGAAFEARVLEGLVLNALAEAGLSFGERFYALHGTLPIPVEVAEESIPEGWSLAKKRYLARCVELYGASLATAGIHTNHSFPEALLSWDFFHLPRHERAEQNLVDYRNRAVIRATRLLRPYCPLFIAISAASPLGWERVNGRPALVINGADSNRLLTFPNPAALDVPYLYASHADYLRISYELVRSGIRFGANNWTPVRARSDVDPVNRNISATSEQLRQLYSRGVYSAGEHRSLEEAERALVVENLCARVDLPMNRVEVRTDEGGDTLELAVAKVALKDLLLMRIYGDPAFGSEYAYDGGDVERARRNEREAAERGLDAVVVEPFTRQPVAVRDWLGAVLDDLAPLAEALGRTEEIEPLRGMADGALNPAAAMRAWLESRLGGGERASSGSPIVPLGLLREWMEARERSVAREVLRIAGSVRSLGDEAAKLAELLGPLERASRTGTSLPVRIAPHGAEERVTMEEGPVAEVVSLASALVRIPSVTNCADERPDEVLRCARFIAGRLREAGAEVRLWDGGRYPAVFAGFPGRIWAPVTLAGHFDVVRPDPNDSQFEPVVEGDFLWGRGSADMKTLVASIMVWMRRVMTAGPPFPAVNLLLVGNEENGETEPFGTRHVLADLKREAGWSPEFMIVGERTGEQGSERFGEVCTSNRGVVRVRLVARGERTHTGFANVPADLLDRLIAARQRIGDALLRHLTLSSEDDWQSSARFPFLTVGESGVYNLTAGEGMLGLEVRPIPEDDARALVAALQEAARELDLEMAADVVEGGVTCPPDNPHLAGLLAAVERVSGAPARVGRKLAGTSARFAPGGNAAVWGQSGIGPHTRHERHFIPSIEPYLRVLDAFAGTHVI